MAILPSPHGVSGALLFEKKENCSKFVPQEGVCCAVLVCTGNDHLAYVAFPRVVLAEYL